MRGLIVLVLVTSLLSSLVLADHRNPNLPFCGDGKLEKTALWDETNGKYPCRLDQEHFFGCQDEETKFGIGTICTRQGTQGLCLRNGICYAGLQGLVGKKASIEVLNLTVALEEPVHIRIFDPGRGAIPNSFTNDAYVIRIEPNGSKHYMVNFCNKRAPCVHYNDEGSSAKGDKDGTWWGFPVYEQPGVLRKITDFSSFDEIPPEEEQDHWYATTTKKSRYIGYFAFTKAGEYQVEFIDMLGNRVTSESFIVCDPTKNCDPVTITGLVGDGHNFPVPNMEVLLQQDDQNFTTYTDEDGKYSFTVFIDDAKDVQLTYILRGENSFEIIDEATPADYFGSVVRIRLKEMLPNDLPKDFDFTMEDIIEAHNGHNDTVLPDLARTHILISMLTEFADEELDVDLGGASTYIVQAFSSHTAHSGGMHTTLLSQDDSVWNAYERPDNSDWHEGSHAIMYASNIGGKESFPMPHHGNEEYNHLGYANPSTTDSWVEGFAVFLSSVIANELDFNVPADKPWLYRVGYSSIHLEDNVKVWSDLGTIEDLAAATLLWDVYDSADFYGKDDDKVSLPLKELWPILNKAENIDMKDIYDALIKVADKDDIDDIYVAHGFFEDTNANRKHDDGEEIGRAANGGAFYSSYDFDGGKFWDVDLPIGRFVTPGEFGPKAADPLIDDIPRWGSADTDGDGDIPVLKFTGDAMDYGSAAIDLDGDGDFGILSDLDNDTLGELTTDPFWVFPFKERRNIPISPRTILDAKLIDKEGKPVTGQLLFEVVYDNHPERNYEYTTPFGENLNIWVPEEATLTITAISGEVESEPLVINGKEFQERLLPRQDQGEHTFQLPVKASQLDKNDPESYLGWFILLIVLVLVAAGYVFLKKKRRA